MKLKLITKFILIYLLVSITVLTLGGIITYLVIKTELDRELKWEYLDQIDRITHLIEQGGKYNVEKILQDDRNFDIQRLEYPTDDRVIVSDTLVWDNRLEQEEKNVKVSVYRTIDGTSYYISTYGNLIESDDITNAVVKIHMWILGMQVVGAVGIGFLVSGPLFRPFKKTLSRMKHFQLNKKDFITADNTNVIEFSELNRFVEDLTKKAVTDYKNLKEFAENASHELQTPLAIAKGKLELLVESGLTAEQYEHVEKLEKTIKYMSQLSQSLSLLTKIENHEFSNDQNVNLSELIREGIESFREFVELNNLEVQAEIEDNVNVTMHPALAGILWSNLYQNAIRHNVKQGKIMVELTNEKLKISNTGKPVSINPDKLFERFRKADQNTNSIGLGLAIVKQIAENNQFNISYTIDDNWHQIEISFKNASIA